MSSKEPSSSEADDEKETRESEEDDESFAAPQTRAEKHSQERRQDAIARWEMTGMGTIQDKDHITTIIIRNHIHHDIEKIRLMLEEYQHGPKDRPSISDLASGKVDLRDPASGGSPGSAPCQQHSFWIGGYGGSFAEAQDIYDPRNQWLISHIGSPRPIRVYLASDDKIPGDLYYCGDYRMVNTVMSLDETEDIKALALDEKYDFSDEEKLHLRYREFGHYKFTLKPFAIGTRVHEYQMVLDQDERVASQEVLDEPVNLEI